MKDLEKEYYETISKIKTLRLYRRNNANKKNKQYLVKASLREERKLRKYLRIILKQSTEKGFLVD